MTTISERYSKENKKRILNNDQDWYDKWLTDKLYKNKEPDVPRNLRTVSTAATKNYWSDRANIIDD